MKFKKKQKSVLFKKKHKKTHTKKHIVLFHQPKKIFFLQHYYTVRASSQPAYH